MTLHVYNTNNYIILRYDLIIQPLLIIIYESNHLSMNDNNLHSSIV